MEPPETRYARTSDDVSIAYQVVGNGPVDLVWIPGYVSHVEFAWTHPPLVRLYQWIASFSRLIMLDRRGVGQRGLLLAGEGRHAFGRRLRGAARVARGMLDR